MLSPKNAKRPRPTWPSSEQERQIWFLAHLVNATTSELSACLSYNILLQQCNRSVQNMSETWHTCLLLSRKSLIEFVDNVHHFRRKLPRSIPQEPPGPPIGHTTRELWECERKSRAYTALVVAAHATQPIEQLLKRLEVAESSISVRVGIEHPGWVDGEDLTKLKDIHTDLLRFRDRGVDDHNVGWKASWLTFTELFDMK